MLYTLEVPISELYTISQGHSHLQKRRGSTSCSEGEHDSSSDGSLKENAVPLVFPRADQLRANSQLNITTYLTAFVSWTHHVTSNL